MLAFIRITTQPKLFQQPFSIEEAVSIVDGWLSQPNVQFLHAGEDHWSILRGLLLDTEARGKLVRDAHLAALAIENDSILLTRDGDFDRFQGVRTVNPLTSEPDAFRP